MPLVADTYSPDNDLLVVASDSTSQKKGLQLHLSETWALVVKKDVFVKYIKEEFVLDISKEELTTSAYTVAESSLAKLWENEDDEYWASY